MSASHLIIFDGICAFCNGAVHFIIKRDPRAIFIFTPIQSPAATELIRLYPLNYVTPNTLILIKNEQCYVRSDAALEITKDLSGAWFLLRIFKIIPRGIRDLLYTLFAKNRYRLFGQKPTCMVPTEEIKNRFI